MRTNIREKIVSGKYTLPVIIILYIVSFALFREDAAVHEDGGMLWDFMTDRMPILFSTKWIALILHALAVYMILELDAVFALIRIRTTFQISCFLILLTIFPDIMGLNPGTFAGIAIFASFFPLFYSYQRKKTPSKMFKSGFLLAIASLFFPKALWLLPIYILGTINMSSLTLRNLIALVWGTAMPLIFISGYCFCYDCMDIVRNMFAEIFTVPRIDYSNIALPTVIDVCTLILITIISTGHFTYTSFKDKIKTRLLLYFITWISTIVFVMILLLPHLAHELLSLVIMPVSLIVAHTFCLTESRSGNIYFIITAILFVALFIYNFFV